MLKLQTPVECGTSRIPISLNDKLVLLGSCFTDNIGQKMRQCGFNVCVNPFGTLYNPVSVCNSVHRLASAVPFSEEECVNMGAGSPLVCSFSHHTAAARADKAAFLEDANKALAEASAFFQDADTIIITLGTAWTFRHIGTGEIVSNCLKRDAKEFMRERLSVKSAGLLLNSVVERYGNSSALLARSSGIKPKRFIFTVSPIRHFKDGAHGNQISKSTLLLAEQSVCDVHQDICEYFPAYEIMTDELRDYRFYAEDMVHPSQQAIDYIWERFCDFALPAIEKPALGRNRKAFLQSMHRCITRSE